MPPAPAVRGQQRAALGLRPKLRGVGFWAWRRGCELLEAWFVGPRCRVWSRGGKGVGGREVRETPPRPQVLARLNERGLFARLGPPGSPADRRGERQKRLSVGEALLQDSFARDLESLFLSPNYGAWVRRNRWKLYFVPKRQ